MSQAPSMPMYWDAYLADTTHLSTEEHGAYMLLLGAMWRRNGFVPDDDIDNARILGMTKAKWKRIKARLSTLLIIENDTITQKKLQKIWKNTQEKIQTNRTNGSLGGRPKSNKNKDMPKANGYVSHNPNHNRNETIPEPEPYPEEERKKDSPLPPKKERDDYQAELPVVSFPSNSATPTEGRAMKKSAKPDTLALFEAFWLACPRRVGKGAARIAYDKALTKTNAATILDAVTVYAGTRDGQDQTYTAHPSTWLNQERWMDDLTPPENFYDKVERMLNGYDTSDADEIGDSSNHQRLAPMDTPDAPERDGQAGTVEADSRGDQPSRIIKLHPRKFN